MIIGEIRRYLRDNNSIRVSRSIRDTAYKAIYTKELMMKDSDKEPTVEEIAAKLELAPEDIVFALDAIQSPVSLYEPVYAESGDTLYIMDQIRQDTDGGGGGNKYFPGAGKPPGEKSFAFNEELFKVNAHIPGSKDYLWHMEGTYAGM